MKQLCHAILGSHPWFACVKAPCFSHACGYCTSGCNLNDVCNIADQKCKDDAAYHFFGTLSVPRLDMEVITIQYAKATIHAIRIVQRNIPDCLVFVCCTRVQC